VAVDTSCDGGPADLLIQRHLNEYLTSSDPFVFNRSWTEFKNGFCDSHENFWIGNERLYQATSVQNPTRRRLRVELSALHEYTVSRFAKSYYATVDNAGLQPTALYTLCLWHGLRKIVACETLSDCFEIYTSLFRHRHSENKLNNKTRMTRTTTQKNNSNSNS